MSDDKKVDNHPQKDQMDTSDTNLAVTSDDVSSFAGSVKNIKHSTSSERQIKFERAQKCLENAALVSKRIKEHRKATAELLGKPFDDDADDTASEMASTMSERTGYSVATDTSTTLSVQDALNIPGISESLANTLKQKELLMERIKQYKEISKRPMKTTSPIKKETSSDSKTHHDVKKVGISNPDVTKLINTIKEKENVLSVMQVKMKALETTILDLQEKINEKDQIIEAKNKATTLMSDSLSKKEKDSLDLLEDTQQQMTKMQSNFIAMESEWNDEKQRLLNQICEQEDKIKSLKEANSILENSRFEIGLAHSKLVEELEAKNNEILQLQEKIETITKETTQIVPLVSQNEDQDNSEEKGILEISNMTELTKKIELLELINCQMRQANKDLENQLALMEQKSVTSSPNKKASPHPTRKGRNTASKSKSPWSNLSTESTQQETEKAVNKNESKQEMLLQSLNKDILEKEYLLSQKEEIISKLQSQNNEMESNINRLQQEIDKLTSDTKKVHIGVCTEEIVVPKRISETEDAVDNVLKSDDIPGDNYSLQEKLKSAEDQIKSLNEELEIANKNMIKVKSNNKIKLKQMQKTIDNFSKMADANAEIVKLNEELHKLSQKVAELEEEKGNLQLHLVDYDSGRLTESEVYKKLVEIESLAESRLKSITLLETQKFDLVQELHVLQQKNNDMEDKLADMSQLQNEHVCSEIKSVQLEEQIDELIASKKGLLVQIENLKLDNDQSWKAIRALEEEKEEVTHKLENYIQENMELTDKLEKLSVEKVSSAESIEMVESLTSQEKLELEEYNKNMGTKLEDQSDKDKSQAESDETISDLMKQIGELNKKIELYTQERQEVLDKMNKVCAENEKLQEKIKELNTQCQTLTRSVEDLEKEKTTLNLLNEELNNQIETLKRERIDIMKDIVDVPKPLMTDEGVDALNVEGPHEEKTAGDKSNNRSKSIKQLTKDIIKLKATIKEREAEIADSQMKILSLEEQQQKQNELSQNNTMLDNKLKNLTEENSQLKREIETVHKDFELDQQYKQANDILQQEMQKIHQEYSIAINARDNRIHELENLLVEYKKQMYSYSNTLQQKDKETAEYINQITKLNDVSQKLKSTIDLLEEEKSKDQNAELVKSLNKEIIIYQKKLAECDDKLRILEEEKVKLFALKGALEKKNNEYDAEIKRLQDILTQKQATVKELQSQQQKFEGEYSSVVLEAKERDEEIHEIKLQLRKESIENEKLRTEISVKANEIDELNKRCNEMRQDINTVSQEKEQLAGLETKNKELMEKLKKFAVTIKKKSTLYSELEGQYIEVQKKLEDTNLQMEQLQSEVQDVSKLTDKINEMKKELDELQNEKQLFVQKTEVISQLERQNQILRDKLDNTFEENSRLNVSLDNTYRELMSYQENNQNLKNQVELANNKLVEFEIEQKNNSNLLTKINCLEADLNQKNQHIRDLSNQLELNEQQLGQLTFGHDAKVQERDLYIESLQNEIDKYKNRIYRLEESVSIMEDRRNSLERKADQLDTQLQEKQKAYSEYTNQEDELVNRLAVLIDHDRVVEKQLCEIEKENRDLHHKVQSLNEELQHVKLAYSDLQMQCNSLLERANKADAAESEVALYQSKLHDVEATLKRSTSEHHNLLAQKNVHIEDLESEFNVQIMNALKEKKMLSENYERMAEHVRQLENNLQEYKETTESQNLHIQELSAANQKLLDNCNVVKPDTSVDYTEQYISEINNLNATINHKNQDIADLENKFKTLQMNNVALISNLESKIEELTFKLSESNAQVKEMSKELNCINKSNEQLKTTILQKEDQIKQLTEKNKVVFEMNIPKTEGMTISSTIEQLNEQSSIDLASLQSQIVSEPIDDDVEPLPKIVTESGLVQTAHSSQQPGEIDEPIIVAKKTYDCFAKDEGVTEDDPFSSQEGWGFGGDESEDVQPGFSQFKEEILQLKQENERLKCEYTSSNTKLLKALKKIKELKATNKMLSNELKLSKQLSENSLLDTAIENELSSNLEVLEKKLHDVNNELEKEKREKNALKKQNEIFKNANDRLTEMKEKMDNELELWKYNFKQANDKISALQWGSDSQDSPVRKVSISQQDKQENEEILKLEKENEELQSMVDEINAKNKELHKNCNELQNRVTELQKELESRSLDCVKCENLKRDLVNLDNCNKSLESDINSLNSKIIEYNQQYVDFRAKYEQLSKEYTEKQRENEVKASESMSKISDLEKELTFLNASKLEGDKKLSDFTVEIESLRSQLQMKEHQMVNTITATETIVMAEKLSAMEEECNQMRKYLAEADKTIIKLKNDNSELLKTVEENKKQVDDLNAKVVNLNTENDQLLSTVAELRSNVASAVDQRGYEIAELWKQHLSQRENEFQVVENDLRNKLSAAETKYELLLDNVQSSTQDETNKLVSAEQINSLQIKIQEKEEHLNSLQNKYAETIHQLDMLRSEIDDEKLIHENKIIVQQEEYEKIIHELNSQHDTNSAVLENSLEKMQSELTESKSEVNNLHQQIEESKNAFEAKIEKLTRQIQIKESEIYQKTNDYSNAITHRNEEFENVRGQLIEYEKKIEDLTYEKEAELAVIRLKMHESKEQHENIKKELESEKKKLIEALNAKIIECTHLNKQITDLNIIIQEYSTKSAEMQQALENQELEIVSLKDEIAQMQDLMRSSSSKIEKHVTFSSDTKQSDEIEKPQTFNKDLLDAVPRAELDIALYMLHQRDVRCEELTMELTQLLEERDTLQLRLSDSLRAYEELRSKNKPTDLNVSAELSHDAVYELPTFSIEKEQHPIETHRRKTSRSSSTSDYEGEKPQLQAKLSELRSVKHSRDVTLRQDSEQRQLGMRLMHRDVANLPPEALEQLTQAHHTLTRDSQSTPTMLLNWLRGKSTPKVVHM